MKHTSDSGKTGGIPWEFTGTPQQHDSRLQAARLVILPGGDVWHGKNWPDCNGSVATTTRPTAREHYVGEARSVVQAGEPPRAWSREAMASLATCGLARLSARSARGHRCLKERREPQARA